VTEAPLYSFEAGGMRLLRFILMLLTIVSIAGCVIVVVADRDA
jgi:hypothetical protein